MKSENKPNRFCNSLCILAIVSVFFAVACGGDDPVQPEIPTDQPEIPSDNNDDVVVEGDIVFTVGDGSSDISTPFAVAGGDELNLEIKQKNSYTQGDKVYTVEPKAAIKLKAKNASNFVEDLEALSTQIETADPVVSESGTNPVTALYKGSFATLGQSFDFETSYEVYETENGDEMPYLKFGEPKLVNIEVKQRATTRVIVSDTTYYDVVAKFEVGIEGVNTKDKLNETLSFDVNYTGGVVTTKDVPIELVKTEYRKDMLFHAPHDNLMAANQAVVYRDRYYSDGSIQTDTLSGLRFNFLEYGSLLKRVNSSDVIGKGEVDVELTEGLTIKHGKVEHYTDNVGVERHYSSVEIPDFENLDISPSGTLDWEEEDWPDRDVPSENLTDYESEGGTNHFDTANPIDDFYFDVVSNLCTTTFRYKYNGKKYQFLEFFQLAKWYDRFACVDGNVISFDEFRPSIKRLTICNKYRYEALEATTTRGPARVFTSEFKGTFLDQEIHLICVDTVYVAK